MSPKQPTTPPPPPFEPLKRSYEENYDAIAHDHVAYWREHGSNPFQGDVAVKVNRNATVALLRRYVPPGSRILDAGCAMGDLLMDCPEYEGHGVDIASEYLAIAAERGLNVRRANAEKLPYRSGWFDAVIATDLLEHVLDFNAVVRELLRVLRHGGVLIARSPHAEDLADYVNFTVYDFVHLRRFDEATFRLQFPKIFGCEVLECPLVGAEIHAVVRKP